VTAEVTAAGRAAATRLMIATVATGRVTAVPGTTVGSGNGVAFGWQAGSHQLIADVAVDTSGQPEWQIAVWRPGDARLFTALVRTADESWPVIDQGPY
jgi:transketolase C-terminal domain/subunit